MKISRDVSARQNFLRLAQTVERLMEAGATHQVIDDLLREKILSDLSREMDSRERRRTPSEN